MVETPVELVTRQEVSDPHGDDSQRRGIPGRAGARASAGVGKTYAQPVLAGVSLALHAGEVLALTGENGAGKSTLSKIVGGLERPAGGSLELLGRRRLTPPLAAARPRRSACAW